MNKINRFLPSYFLVIYIIFILTTALFTLRISSWSIATVLIITPSLLFYPFLQLLPALALSQAAGWSLCKAPRAQLAVTGTVTVLAVYIVHLFLLLDSAGL